MEKLRDIVIFCVLHLVAVSSFPESSDFHKLLNKEQLQKYFSVHNHEEVPEYILVNIQMKKYTPPTREPPPNHLLQQRGQANQAVPQSILMFIATESVFGHDVQMQLRPNDRLLAPSFKVVKIEGEGDRELDSSYNPVCHYIGSNGSTSAAVSDCGFSAAKGLSGILMLPSGSAQIQPVDQDLVEQLGISLGRNKRSAAAKQDENLLHLISKAPQEKKLYLSNELKSDDEDIVNYLDFYDLNSNSVDSSSKDEKSSSKDGDESVAKGQQQYAKGNQLYLELAVFFDQKGYELFHPHVKSEDNMVNLILGYVNQMQALYQQPSLRKNMQISLVRLELMKQQPADLPHADGERDQLLDSFCAYQAKKNPDSDSDPNHWDLALYISGLNFYTMVDGKKNGITMGLAPVGGVCMKKHACVITEFGTTSDDGRPYPSAGLLSTYIAAHEIGHNLGMYHDGPPHNDCPANGHMMSASRGTRGKTTWSKCSSEVLEKSTKECLLDKPHGSPAKGRDHSKFGEKPGQVWDAYHQCKVFLLDEEATLYNETVISTVCYEILCKTPQRIGYYAAGPALEGTFCGGRNWCKGGQCVPWGSHQLKVVKGGWSDWKKGACKSGCLKDSRAFTLDRRYCNNPKPMNSEERCAGDNIRIGFCDDSKICKKYKTIEDYAKERCQYFSKYLPTITPMGVQVKYSNQRQSQSCSIYCKTKSGPWYSPRQELNDRDIDTFFPDGTWCHNDGQTNYFCQDHLCQPPPVKGQNLLSTDPHQPRGRDPEIKVPVFNNARPKGGNRSPKKLKEFFQYKVGKLHPMPSPEELGRPNEEDYVIIDYVVPV